ncbi:MAG: sugar phosphate isomerase/epimerase [Oscillospiraceae bacterium]|jgi:sugar phosphate isomerase/epimerase|nr:sugar phosphate isomerase/epimerase [Oscillospiraceae bacterium]
MRFGAPILDSYDSPSQWVEIVKRRGYSAANSPLKKGASDADALAYGKAAKDAGIVIAEQGSWHCNCLSRDSAEREAAIAQCIRNLELAELLEARCCVSLSGSRADKWDAPHKDNISDETFDMVVSNAQRIIDAVQPKNTYYAFEPMPWTFPFNAQSQLRLLEAVDRRAYAVHYDPVNLVYSPDRYFKSGQYITNFIEALGPYIRVCHIKDVILLDSYVWQLHERRPGEGELDYDALFTALNKLDPDLPVTTEHLATQDEYDKAEAFIRGRIKKLGITLK